MSADAGTKGYRLAGGLLVAGSLVAIFVFGMPWFLGFGAFVLGLGFLGASFILNGLPNMIGSIWNSATPEWDGEILQTDGGDSKVRYGFDPTGSPWFVAGDVCRAIGEKAPGSRAATWQGIRLVMRNGVACFAEDGVRKYLSPLAIHNREAARMLTLLQREVFRKLEKGREQKALNG
jgi:hypothetical protein